MEINLPEPNLKNVAGAAGTALLLPLGMPIVHGVAGLAVAGLGIFAAGTAVTKVAGAVMGQIEPPSRPMEEGEGSLEDRLKSPV
ncbi:hypothetical protein [Chlorobium sp. N1]|uniref:hypothetical protein n=1 Tax=Chlorobium sp. N1 TaxID=2491138 RepID=UPI00103D0F6F|nr:hypothetical protein [Chlorobium sp. N1]TCD47134.1 hypothetical protein E0L29_09490 [Chlorobium sp. N1]